ncbi:MAG TPA: DUF5668 domain-containing protein [Noviherbaspirillum sp.]|nr:DUF5668 domain-containing protein [Noviherbaspirillum sp.]
MENARQRRRDGLLAPLILIVFGVVLLLERNGVLDRHTIWQWLPALPVLLGGSLLLARVKRHMGR